MTNMNEKNVKIKLQAPDDVKDFVASASKCDFDIDLMYNRIIVDAKSFLGVLSMMGLRQDLTVACRGYDESFQQTLQKYAVM